MAKRNKNGTPPTSQLNMWQMLLLAAIVGLIAGFGAVFFRLLIGTIHNISFYLHFDSYYQATKHAVASRWGYGIIVVPVIGALMVTWLTKNFAPEAKGHGVPEAMESIFFKGGKIRPIVALVKCIASAITIGTGGSVGREGPIIQIGSAFGSILGQLINIPARQRIVLLAAGAGAGIAATFNAPIGGMAFAVELLLVSISSSTIAVVAVATVIATQIGRIFLGFSPAFNIPKLFLLTSNHQTFMNLIAFIPLGIIIGVSSSVFIKSIYWSEDYLEKKYKNEYIRNGIASFLLGVIIFAFMRYSSHYYVQGVGYATIADVLNGSITGIGFLLLLFLAKLIATCLTLGGGGSGGVFSPSLFLGATLSAAFGIFMNHLVPASYSLNPAVYAVAGMAAMIASTTGAVLTAITMIFEMTRNYNAILPIIITISLSYALRRRLCPQSIYTLKLMRRGRPAHEGLQAAIYSSRCAKDIMSDQFQLIEKEMLATKATLQNEELDLNLPQVIHNENKILGLLNLHNLNKEEDDKDHDHNNLIDLHYLVVSPNTNIFEILRRMQKKHAQTIIVSSLPRKGGVSDIIGIITPLQISALITQSAELFH